MVEWSMVGFGMGMGKNDWNISYFGAYSKLGVLLIQSGGLVGFLSFLGMILKVIYM